jgi:hypothetical protein
MRRYAQVSGAFFGVVAVGQLVRVIERWPVQVAGFSVPVWASVCAVVFAATLAIWAFSTAKDVP